MMSAPVALSDVPMADWMAHLPGALWDIPLCSLAIPGTGRQPCALDHVITPS